jgi:hypothetical protein
MEVWTFQRYACDVPRLCVNKQINNFHSRNVRLDIIKVFTSTDAQVD